VPLTRDIVIEREDFSAEPPKGFKRLTPGGTVRLRGAGIIRCDEVVPGANGEPSELRVTLLGEDAKAAGVIHWVSATRGVKVEFRLFDRLFTVANPEGDQPAPPFDPEQPGHEDETQPVDTDFMRFVNPQSLVVTQGVVEPSVAKDPAGTRYQFERAGYFWRDPVDSRDTSLVFNRIITLKDTWGRKEAEEPKAQARPKAEKKPEAAAQQQPVRPALSPEQEGVFARLRKQGVTENDAHLLAREPQLTVYLEGAGEARLAELAPWVVNDLAPAIREGTNRVDVKALGELVALLAQGGISVRIAKEVLAEAQTSGEAPARIVERKGLRVVSDEGQLRAAIQGVLDANPAKVAEYRGGKKGLTGFFTGQVMRATNGQADPKSVAKLLSEMLG
jgi:glutaminyl-tRNA synthetase